MIHFLLFLQSTTNWQTSDIIALIAVCLSAASFLIVLYQEFFRGPKLQITANAIATLRIPTHNKSRVLMDLLVIDIQSDQPSPVAETLLRVPDVATAVENEDTQAISEAIAAYSRIHAIDYNPPENLYEHIATSKHFRFNFYIPLYAYNTGKRTGYIRSLILVIQSNDNQADQWIFTPFMELDDTKLMDRSQNWNDNQRIKKSFVGFSIPPQSAHRLDPWFIPLDTLGDVPVNAGPIEVGNYSTVVRAYDGRGKMVAKSTIGSFEINLKHFAESLSGSESFNYLHSEEDARDALGL